MIRENESVDSFLVVEFYEDSQPFLTTYVSLRKVRRVGIDCPRFRSKLLEGDHRTVRDKDPLTDEPNLGQSSRYFPTGLPQEGDGPRVLES